MTQIYTILDNGGEPFKVIVDYKKNHLQVLSYNNLDNYDNIDNILYDKLVFETDFTDIFIGLHPKNLKIYSEDFDKNYEGNSILAEIDEKTYVFIGMNIFKFNSINKINYYLSVVGNNCFPYPYAIDDNNNIYLMIENKIMILENDTFEYIKEIGDPYMFHYGHAPRKNHKYISHQLPNYQEIVKRL